MCRCAYTSRPHRAPMVHPPDTWQMERLLDKGPQADPPLPGPDPLLTQARLEVCSCLFSVMSCAGGSCQICECFYNRKLWVVLPP